MKKYRIFLIAFGLIGLVAIFISEYVGGNIALPSAERVELESLLKVHPAIVKRYNEITQLQVLENGYEWASGNRGSYGTFQFIVSYGKTKNAKIRVKWTGDDGAPVKIDAIYEIEPMGLIKIFPESKP